MLFRSNESVTDKIRQYRNFWEDELAGKIDKNQNFYINNNGEIVISFDEYEVAPGYMGVVEFTIPNSVINSIK